jgi:hypothetical protein
MASRIRIPDVGESAMPDYPVTEYTSVNEIAEVFRGNADSPVPVTVRIGITGTREHPSDSQRNTLGMLITACMTVAISNREIHHGCATGADEFAHQIALTIPGLDIHGHPGYGHNRESPHQMIIRPAEFTSLWRAKLYRDRNYDIVAACDLLIAIPQYPENDSRSERSGTWQTVRIARRARISIIEVTPTGSLKSRDMRQTREIYPRASRPNQ